MFISLNSEEKNIVGNKEGLTPLSKGSKFKSKKEEKIVTMYKNGEDVNNITKELNVSMGLVYTVLNNYKVPKRRKQSKVAKRVEHITKNESKVKQLINDYQFMNLVDIYRKYDIHKNGLYYILDLYNVKRKSDEKDIVLADNEE